MVTSLQFYVLKKKRNSDAQDESRGTGTVEVTEWAVCWGPPSLLVPALHSHGSTQLCSGCFSSAASISLFLCPSASAGVASHSILLAITAAAARVCMEAGGRVVTNMFVRDMDLGVLVAGDNRRLKVVVDGLPLHGGVQLAMDTTLVSFIRGSGEPRQGAATTDGVALTQARRRKEKTYRELTGPGARARLVVLALEVGGRWSAGSEVVCGSAGQSPRTVRATSAAAQDGTGVETEVVIHPLVCSLVCHVSPWSEGDNWC